MRRSLRGAILAVVVATTLAVVPAAWAQDDTFEFTIDTATLATDRHTVVVGGTYICGPMNLEVTAGGGTVDLTVRQGQVTGFGFVPIQVCDGTAQLYEAEVTTFGEASFRQGAARASASGFVTGGRDGVVVTFFTSIDNQRITIRRP